MPRAAPRLHTGKCTGCGVCIEICPAEAIALDEEGKARIDCEVCLRCMACVEACPERALYAAR